MATAGRCGSRDVLRPKIQPNEGVYMTRTAALASPRIWMLTAAAYLCSPDATPGVSAPGSNVARDKPHVSGHACVAAAAAHPSWRQSAAHLGQIRQR
jgi:hypothetical protein